MKYGMVPLLSSDQCSRWLSHSFDAKTEFCAGWEDGRTDTCKGDSGGALICLNRNKWSLYGIVSWGEGCGKPMKPGVYTKVAHFMPWIVENLRES